MKMLKAMTTLFALTGALALGETAPYTPHPDWENPENLHQNREDSRAFFVPYATEKEALKGHRDDSSFVLSLNGDWQFNWVPSPSERPVDFYKPDYDASSWAKIDVPSNWQMRGYGTPIYANQPYTMVRNAPFVMTPARNANEEQYTTIKSEPNAVGSYRKTVTIPEDWDGREVFIQFDGVDSFFYLFVNGQKVGFSKDSRTAAVFNITPYLKKGKNLVCAEVYRYSDGTYLECQDMWRLSGIFRDVFLYSTPKVHVRDFFVHTRFLQNPWGNSDYGLGKLTIDVDVRNLDKDNKGYALEGVLLDKHNNTVANLTTAAGSLKAGEEAKTELSAELEYPALWSAEKPNLYRLILKLKDSEGKVVEIISKRVGFRDIKLKDGRFLINGMPVKLKGVNRHESNHANGHYVTEEQCREELVLMKRANINHVRNSHYPQPAYFYDLCDELGIYVCDEANIESHGYYYGEDSLSHPKEWKAQHVWRNINMVEQAKNHPCVVIWSYGNEAGPGKNFDAVRDWIKQRDPSRLTQYERNNDLADLSSNQYPSIDWCRTVASRKIDKPWYVSEYAHILCNAMGNLQDYWDAFESSDSFIGGAIWEWIHQSYDQKVTMPDGKVVTRQSYGGDWGDYPNDGIFCIKGVIYSDRTPTPLYSEIRKVQQNIGMKLVKSGDVRIAITNKNLFTNLSEYDCQWTLCEEGNRTVSSGQLAVDLAPLQTREFVIPAAELLRGYIKPDREYFLTMNFTLKQKTDWAERGYVVATEQFKLPEALTNYSRLARTLPLPAGLEVEQKLEGKDVVLTGQDFTVTIDGATGGLKNYTSNGEELIGATPTLHLNAYRAPLANDQWIMQEWFKAGLRNMTHTASPLKMESSVNGAARISCQIVSRGIRRESMGHYTSGKGYIVDEGAITEDDFHFTTQMVYTVLPNGMISVQASITPSSDKLTLPKLGFTMALSEDLDKATWYGRGPGENYPDRKVGAPIGIYTRNVEDMVEDYPKPMEMGNRMDSRWVALTGSNGAGIAVCASPDESFNFSALPFTPQAITDAAHPEELKAAGASILSIDAKTLGLGGASCGPRPMDRDITTSTPCAFAFSLRPVKSGESVTAVARPSLPLTDIVTLSRDSMGYVSASCPTKDATIYLRVDHGQIVQYRGPFVYRGAGVIQASAGKEGCLNSAKTEIQLDTWQPAKLWSVIGCSSQAGGREDAKNIFDGRKDTIWHNNWRDGNSRYPYTILIDMGMESTIEGFNITPRQDRDGTRVKTIKFYCTDIPEDLSGEPELVAHMINSADTQSFKLDKPKRARYVTMICTEPFAMGSTHAAIAEVDPIIKVSLDDYPAQVFYTVNYVSSELAGIGAARNVLDGNPSTYWHSMKGVTLADFPHELRINLGDERALKGITYKAAYMAEGRIKGYKIYVSTDGENWGEPVATGELANTTQVQNIMFPATQKANFVRFVATSSHDGGSTGAIAEIGTILE
ncbi:MAG: glycoside hydrolase family 2 TIM barrel-domain containing protein [Akkermansia sp.]